MVAIPHEFIQRMTTLLGDEAQRLFAVLEQEPWAGLRVNTTKIQPHELQQLLDWQIDPVAWCPNGFVVANEVQAGKHAYHAAGLYYLQEPSAMAVSEVVQPQAGELVLDLAAAPGGKSTHLIALAHNDCTLVANDIEYGRTKALASNLERWGAKRAIITNDEPQRLAQRWGAIFDRVLLDAPCSGEGMFRKSEAALQMWSPDIVHGCAMRQRHAIMAAAQLVKVGGYLVYSTCTFAPEENEQVIADFVRQHPEFELRPIMLNGVDHGRADWTSPVMPELAHTARLWTHNVRGEGHFVALMQRTSGMNAPRKAFHLPPASKATQKLWRDFVAVSLPHDPAANALIIEHNGNLYAVPPDAPACDHVRLIRAGLWLGSVERHRFEPSHGLALACIATDVRRMNHVSFSANDDQLDRYLQGHPLPSNGANGWLLVCVDGYPIGWGRRAQNIIKNAYPKGLRRPLRS